jgi:hypothetical protein
MVAPGSYKVEQIVLQRDLRRPGRPYLRVTRGGYWIDDCASPAQVARYVDLTELVVVEEGWC